MSARLVVAESRRRTVARAVTYRLLAMASSFALVGVAAGILVEISKTVIYYLVERGWLYVDWQLAEGRESQLRIWTRAIVYRTIATVAVAYWVGIESALVLAVIQTLLFYLNEIAWKKIKWQ